MISRPILFLEDNPGDVELASRGLHEASISNELVVKATGEETLDYLFNERDASNMPVIVLLDLKLPGGMPGIEVLRRIRQNESTKLLPVIVLTSSKEEDDLISSYQHGANAYIRKPVNFDKFVEVIKALGIFWILWNEAPPTKRGT